MKLLELEVVVEFIWFNSLFTTRKLQRNEMTLPRSCGSTEYKIQIWIQIPWGQIQFMSYYPLLHLWPKVQSPLFYTQHEWVSGGKCDQNIEFEALIRILNCFIQIQKRSLLLCDNGCLTWASSTCLFPCTASLQCVCPLFSGSRRPVLHLQHHPDSPPKAWKLPSITAEIHPPADQPSPYFPSENSHHIPTHGNQIPLYL